MSFTDIGRRLSAAGEAAHDIGKIGYYSTKSGGEYFIDDFLSTAAGSSLRNPSDRLIKSAEADDAASKRSQADMVAAVKEALSGDPKLTDYKVGLASNRSKSPAADQRIPYVRKPTVYSVKTRLEALSSQG